MKQVRQVWQGRKVRHVKQVRQVWKGSQVRHGDKGDRWDK